MRTAQYCGMRFVNHSVVCYRQVLKAWQLLSTVVCHLLDFVRAKIASAVNQIMPVVTCCAMWYRAIFVKRCGAPFGMSCKER